MKKVYIIHENKTWITPLTDALENMDTPFEEWFIDDYSVKLEETPPPGVFYNRMSASSHLRAHVHAPEMTAVVLSWLEANNAQVLNGRNALKLEVSKMEQYYALNKQGIKTPKTICVSAIDMLLEAAKELNLFPFILKPNRGGKGTGVQLFYSIESLAKTIEEEGLPASRDGIWLVQEYIKPHDGTITRVEFINSQFYYAVRVDATGGFELCPADSCQINDDFCPTKGSEQFQIIDQYQNDDLEKYHAFLASNDIHIGALEYVKDANGVRYVYDVNTNTNYNAAAEQRNGKELAGMRKIAEELTAILN